MECVHGETERTLVRLSRQRFGKRCKRQPPEFLADLRILKEKYSGKYGWLGGSAHKIATASVQ